MKVLRYFLQSAARQLLPGERVSKCLRVRISSRPVELYHSPLHQSAFYGNLCQCASVWHCPVCSTKISERRRQHWDTALKSWEHGSVLFVTLTMSHKRSESCQLVLAAISQALRSFYQSHGWRSMQREFSIEGTVRSLEVTHSLRSGWHPHYHLFFFLGISLGSLQPFRHALRQGWQAALKKNSRYAKYSLGANVKFVYGHEPIHYILKHEDLNLIQGDERWTAGAELVKAVAKQGRRQGNRTPLQLLYDYARRGDRQAGQIWKEYARAFKGRRHIFPSRGLRQKLGLPEIEKSDRDLVENKDDMAVLLAYLTESDWSIILKHDVRGELLDVASSGELEDLQSFLQSYNIFAVYPGVSPVLLY